MHIWHICRIIGTHTVFFFGMFKLIFEVAIEVIEYCFPILIPLCNVVQLIFKTCSKGIIHQFWETFSQTIGNNVTHLFCIEAFVFQSHITTILNSRNNRRVGGWTANAFFLKLFYQASFGITCRRLSKMLARVKLN